MKKKFNLYGIFDSNEFDIVFAITNQETTNCTTVPTRTATRAMVLEALEAPFRGAACQGDQPARVRRIPGSARSVHPSSY
jgi:hypothetical protein